MAATTTTVHSGAEARSVHDQGDKTASVRVVPMAERGSKSTVDPEKHAHGWPNEAGWNATEEQRQLKELQVTGSFPAWAAGTLLRIGPSMSKIPSAKGKNGEFAVSHWFDGFSTLHKFQIEDKGDGTARVSHQSRHQTDELVAEAQRTGRIDKITFGQKRDPCDSLFKKLKTTFEPQYADTAAMQNICVNLQPAVHKDMLKGANDPARVYTTTSDNCKIKSFDMDTLEPFGMVSQKVLHPSLEGPLSSAHAGRDRDTGDLFNFNLQLGRKATYRVFRTRATDGSTEVLATLSGLDAAYIHSTFLTDNFYILCVWPLKYAAGGAAMLWKRNIVEALAFDSTAKTTWVVVDRRHGRGEVARFTSAAMFSFHTINAWESVTDEGRDIECELVAYPNADIVKLLEYGKLSSASPAAKRDTFRPGHVMARYTLAMTQDGQQARGTEGGNPHVARCTLETAPAHAVELPTMNTGFAQRRHRYVYGLTQLGHSSFTDGIGKTDMVQGTSTAWREHGQTPGEAIFVARPGAEGEDDGVLLSVVLDGLRGSSYLLCLNAATMQELGRADAGTAIGFGLHGVHLAAAAAAAGAGAGAGQQQSASTE